jgi:transcription termination factor Rho
MNINELETKSREELLELAKGAGLTSYTGLKKQDLIMRLLGAYAEQQGYVFCGGILETTSEGYGFLRQDSLLPSSADVYVSQSQIRRFGLRNGDTVAGQGRPPKEGEKYYGLVRVEAVNGTDPELAKDRPTFGSLTPTFPDKLINLETAPTELSTRLVNLIAPIGRGQRGLIVSPPKAGKTILLKSIANAITTNYNDIGKDVVILLDGITRLTRSYNLVMPPSGRTLSGGIDPAALYPAKHFFGAARNTEEGGSLTIIATCLIDTGSRMDELIYEEFKGTGNMELHLDRRLSERRIFPAMDIQRSGTRREELLLGDETVKQVWLLRRMVSMIANDTTNFTETTERVIDRLRKTKTNAEFLANLTKET